MCKNSRHYHTTITIQLQQPSQHNITKLTLSFCVQEEEEKPSNKKQAKQINIYIHLIIKTIIIIILILLGTFPARVVCLPLAAGVGRLVRRCPGGGRVSLGSRGLLKLSQPGSCWQVGKYWERCWGTPCGKAAQPQPQSG